MAIVQTLRVETWRLLIDPPGPAAYNMAVDDAIAEFCRAGSSPPTFRLYAWDRPSISLGYFQRPEDVVDLERCRATGVPVVRRITGGRAVFHQYEVAYSLAAPIPHPMFPSTIKGAFATVARAFATGLSELGVLPEITTLARPRSIPSEQSPCCFSATSRYEITLDGKKLIGSAQRRWKTAFLQHGSVLLWYDHAAATSWFRAGALRPPASVPEPWGLNTNGRSLTPERVGRALVNGWTSHGVSFQPSGLTVRETQRVVELSSDRNLAVSVAAYS